MNSFLYKGYEIHVYAVPVAEGRWDAVVHISPVNTEAIDRCSRLTCLKPTADLAEQQAALWGRRYVDLYGFVRLQRHGDRGRGSHQQRRAG
jgi:hypothetical protein